MKRTAPGYKAQYSVVWRGDTWDMWSPPSRPSLMNWTIEVAKRLRKRGLEAHVICALNGAKIS